MKRVWNVFVLTVLLLALTACGKSTADQWQEQYDLGQKYLLEEDYEAAIVAFTAAIEIDPNEAAAYVGRGDAYVMAASAGSKTPVENYETALADYETALSLYAEEEDTSAVVEKLRERYLALAGYYEEQGDDEQALIYYEKAYQLTRDETISEQIEAIKLDSKQWKADLTEEETAVFENVITAINDGSNEDIYNAAINSDLFSIVKSKGYDTSVSNVDKSMFDYENTFQGTGMCVDITFWEENPQIEIYLGDWKEGMADGEGRLITINGDGTWFEKAVGTWRDGYAEGTFQYEKGYKRDNFESTLIITGELKTGYWDGEVYFTDIHSKTNGEIVTETETILFSGGIREEGSYGVVETEPREVLFHTHTGNDKLRSLSFYIYHKYTTGLRLW